MRLAEWNDLRRIAAAAARSSFLINASVPVGAGSQPTDVCARFCFRPNPLAPIRVADYWIAAVDAKRCLLLLIRSGRAARLCKRVRAAAPTGLPAPGSPLVHSPKCDRDGGRRRGHDPSCHARTLRRHDRGPARRRALGDQDDLSDVAPLGDEAVGVGRPGKREGRGDDWL
jgi:hypothetical protein